MIPILLDGPAVEPVPLAEMKAYLRLDGSDEDALVLSLITAARLMVEAASGRMTITQTWRLVLDAWPSSRLVRVPVAPFRDLVAARVIDAAGAATEIAVSAFTVDARSEPGRIQFGDQPHPGRSIGGIELDVSAGYGETAADVPEPLKQAIRSLATHWFENRGDGPPAGEPVLPAGVRSLISPYRAARL